MQWDIFCTVIDNYGDIGVCWRLSADLAARRQKVRLWVDDVSALAWMAPHGCPGVQVLPWNEPPATHLQHQPCQVLVEAFGCNIASQFIAECADMASYTYQKPVWINLEYLSAQDYVERCHGLPSPVQTGPAAGWSKWFFYPGLSQQTGGLLRESSLLERQACFDRRAWLAQLGISWHGEKLVSLFCYEPAALAASLAFFNKQGPTRLLVTAGRASTAVQALSHQATALSTLSISYLPPLSQIDFDHLLWACDLNFVRGEDSLVRAIWAGKPYVWHIYPQHDNAHAIKLQAFLDKLQVPQSLQQWHHIWNERSAAKLPEFDWKSWQYWAQTTREQLLLQNDLSSRLLAFVHAKKE